jgi:hypothetical protein
MNERQQLEDLCRAVPPPDPQRLAGVRARVLTAIAEGHPAARRGGQRRGLAVFSMRGRRDNQHPNHFQSER